MAVTAFARPRAESRIVSSTVPLGVLVGALVAPALDLLRVVQPSMAVREVAMVAAGAAALLMVVLWARSPRTGWLAAASLAAIASLALRLAGAELGAGLSLLALIGLGVGGAFSSPSSEIEAMLAPHNVERDGTLVEVSPGLPDDTDVASPRPTSDRQLPPRAA